MYLPTNLTANFLDFDAGCPLWTPETAKASPAAEETTGEVIIQAGQKLSPKRQSAMDSEIFQNPKLDVQKG